MPRDKKFVRLEEEEGEITPSMSAELLKLWDELLTSVDIRTLNILAGINYITDGWGFAITRLNDLLSKCVSLEDAVIEDGGVWKTRRKIIDLSKLTDEEKEEVRELLGILDLYRHNTSHTPQMHKVAYLMMAKMAFPETRVHYIKQSEGRGRPLFPTQTSILPGSRRRGGFEIPEVEEE